MGAPQTALPNPAVVWEVSDAIAASRSIADGTVAGPITGVSIDTRTLCSGDLFVALEDARDGHDFVTTAFEKGAAAALVRNSYARRDGDGLLLRCADPLAALVALGRAARARLAASARVVAVTGSAGKTTTKEMLRTALSAIGPTHASEKSYNNHWGVPLTLARMPADTRFGVFEIGMNHAGEITPLSEMVRPHIAVITTVAEAHIENFPDGIAGIARAKAEIFAGMDDGTAVLPFDNPNYPILAEAAARRTLRTVPFVAGIAVTDPRLPACARVMSAVEMADRTIIRVKPQSGNEQSFAVGLFGQHNVSNAVAVAAVIFSLTGDDFGVAEADRALAALADMRPPPGRGARDLLGPSSNVLLIDESYNANPSSIRAALATMSGMSRKEYPRRIAVLGDMLELGIHAPAMHAGLTDAIAAAEIDVVILCGPNMAHLHEALPPEKRGGWGPSSADIEATVLDAVRAGDVVMVKGSNGSRMAPLVEALKARHNHDAKRHDASGVAPGS